MDQRRYEEMTHSELIQVIRDLEKENELLKKTVSEIENKKIREESYKKLPYIRPPWLQ